MKNEYPSEQELQMIEDWDCSDSFGLIEFIRGLWKYDDYFITEWKAGILHLTLHTGGWSGNEDIVDALLANIVFSSLFYTQWKRGGSYYFEITPKAVAYYPLKEMMLKTGYSRQYIVQSPRKFERIKCGKRNNLYRIIKEVQNDK